MHYITSTLPTHQTTIMKKYFFLFIVLCFSFFARAQNVGIGTSTPAAKLDVIGSVKITDGTQGANKILSSAANGLATWVAPPLPAFFTFATDQSVSNGTYIGTGSNSSTFIRHTIVVPFNCELTSIVFSTRAIAPGGIYTATVYIQNQFGTPIATSLSATVIGDFTYTASVTGSVLLSLGDLISIRITSNAASLASGAAVSVTYK